MSRKMILASWGFHAPETIEKCVEFVGKPKSEINFAVINEAYAVERGGHRWVIDDLNSVANNFGGVIDIVDLLSLNLDKVVERINAADVIFVLGGNTDYLMKVFQETGFDKVLPELLETKVYVGSSAGAQVIGRRTSQKVITDIYQEIEYVDKWLELVDVEILPHLHGQFFDRKDRIGSDNIEWIAEEGLSVGCPVYAISDSAAVVVDGDDIYTIGSDTIEMTGQKMSLSDEADKEELIATGKVELVKTIDRFMTSTKKEDK